MALRKIIGSLLLFWLTSNSVNGQILFTRMFLENNFSWSNNSDDRLRYTFPGIALPMTLIGGRKAEIKSGLSLRNTGLIISNDSLKSKYRSWNFGVPLAIMFPFKGTLVRVGGEYELGFHQKVKTYFHGDKETDSGTFMKGFNYHQVSGLVEVYISQDFSIQYRHYFTDLIKNQSSMISMVSVKFNILSIDF